MDNALLFRKPGASAPHPTEFKLPGRDGYLVGRGGELNANDKKELLRNMQAMHQALATGQMRIGYAQETEDEKAAARKLRRETLQAAANDRGGRAFQELGAAVGAEIYETANRDGVMRRFLQKADIVGSVPEIRYIWKQNYAVAASSATQVQPLMLRDRYLYPPEFYVEDHLLIEERDIVRSSADILEEKLIEGQEAIMVSEDKIWKRLVDSVVGVANQQINVVGTFTPQALQVARAALVNYGLPVGTLFFASDVWSDFLTGASFTQFFDPVSQYGIVQTGVIGSLFGLTLMSDSYRSPTQRVLSAGEMYLLAPPMYHGAYTDRGPVVANEVNGMTNGMGMPARGWFMMEILSMTIPNARSVTKIVRT